MRRSELRGGADLKDYRISDILGTRFKDFATTLDADGYTPYTYGYEKRDKSFPRPAGALDTDLTYEFTETLAAIAKAFQAIEPRDTSSYTLASEFSDKIKDAYNKFVAGGDPAVAAKKKFAFDQLPYDAKLTYLIPGFHLLKYQDKSYPKIITDSINDLLSAILYLHYYIAMLDLDKSDPVSIIDLLKQDKLYFDTYVDGIVATMTDNTKFPDIPDLGPDTKKILKASVYDGLKAIAGKIIEEMKEYDKSASNIDTSSVKNLDALDFSTADKMKATLEQKLTYNNGEASALGDAFNKIYGARKSGNNVPVPGASRRIGIVNIDDNELNAFITNSLYNPAYLNSSEFHSTRKYGELFDESVMARPGSSAPTMGKSAGLRTVVTGGSRHPTARAAFMAQRGGADKNSLLILYDMVYYDNDSEWAVTTNSQHRGVSPDANYVTSGTITNIKAVVAGIINTGATSNDTKSFASQVAALAILQFFIENNPANITAVDTDKETIKNLIENNIKKLEKLNNRHNKIVNNEANLQAKSKEFADLFAVAFSKKAFAGLQKKSSGVYESKPGYIKPVKPYTLATQEIKEFYERSIKSDPSFYGKYFNIVEISNGKPHELTQPFVDAIAPTDYSKYRLNVRTNQGWRMFGGGQQFGGKWEIVFLSELKPIDSTKFTGIWISKKDRAKLAGKPTAIQDLFAELYANPPEDDGSYSIQVGDVEVQVTVQTVSRNVADLPTPGMSYSDYMKVLYKNILKTPHGLPSKLDWKDGEIDLKEHLLREASKWERSYDGEGDIFVRKNEDGTDDKTVVPGDNCKLFEDNERECINFFSRCLQSTGDEPFKMTDACFELVDLSKNEFKINPSMNGIADKISQMNPAAAFLILQRFGFGSTLVEDSDPIRGLNRNKVQSVGSWITDLYTRANVNRCANNGEGGQILVEPCDTLVQILGKDNIAKLIGVFEKGEGNSFLTYLEVLVHWVNANPQVLNPAEVGRRRASVVGPYPKPDSSFNSYKYVNPYKSANIRLRSLACDLDRLKANILNETVGISAPALISASSSIPFGLEMPFQRPAFTTPIPFMGSSVSMRGGGWSDYDQLGGENFQYGYVLLDAIYKDLLSTISTVSSDKYRLGGNTQEKIKQKLSKVKEAEDEFIKELRLFSDQIKLIQATHGYVDAFRADDREKLKALMEKHSNLLNASTAYNNRSANIIDIYRTIAEAFLGKIDALSGTQSKTTASGYERPLDPTLRRKQ